MIRLHGKGVHRISDGGKPGFDQRLFIALVAALIESGDERILRVLREAGIVVHDIDGVVLWPLP